MGKNLNLLVVALWVMCWCLCSWSTDTASSDELQKLRFDFRNEAVCPICLDEYDDETVIVVAACQHALCSDCFALLPDGHKECPICRRSLDSPWIQRLSFRTLNSNESILLWPLSLDSEEEMLNRLSRLSDLMQDNKIEKSVFMGLLDQVPLLIMHAQWRGWVGLKQACLEHAPVDTNVNYDFLKKEFIHSVIQSGARYVLVNTGLSETSLAQGNAKEREKRAVALSIAQMAMIERMGGKGRVIYLTDSPVSDAYVRYLYRLINRAQFSGDGAIGFEAAYNAFEREYLDIVDIRFPSDEGVVGMLRTRLFRLMQDKIRNRFVGISAHCFGPTLDTLANKLGIPLLLTSGQLSWGSKSKSRQCFLAAGIRHPRGTYSPAYSREAVVDDIYRLLQIIPGRKVIIKLDRSAAGYGNRILHFKEITPYMDEDTAKLFISERLNDAEVFPESFMSRLERREGWPQPEGAIVEEFIEGCTSSGASLYVINGPNDVSVKYTYQQLLSGADNTVYEGSLGPTNSHDIKEKSRKIGNYLSTQGVCGPMGTDFVKRTRLGKKNLSYAVEINARMTATAYPYFTMETILGKDRMKRRYMKSFDKLRFVVFNNREYCGEVNKDFFGSYLLEHKDSLDVQTGEGCIIHNDTLCTGQLGISCVAKSMEKVEALYERFVGSVQDYLASKFSPRYNAPGPLLRQ
jgi:hypothetical protein